MDDHAGQTDQTCQQCGAPISPAVTESLKQLQASFTPDEIAMLLKLIKPDTAPLKLCGPCIMRKIQYGN